MSCSTARGRCMSAEMREHSADLNLWATEPAVAALGPLGNSSSYRRRPYELGEPFSGKVAVTGSPLDDAPAAPMDARARASTRTPSWEPERCMADRKGSWSWPSAGRAGVSLASASCSISLMNASSTKETRTFNPAPHHSRHLLVRIHTKEQLACTGSACCRSPQAAAQAWEPLL